MINKKNKPPGLYGVHVCMTAVDWAGGMGVAYRLENRPYLSMFLYWYNFSFCYRNPKINQFVHYF